MTDKQLKSSPGPAEAQSMNFLSAMGHVLEGRKVRRESWPPHSAMFRSEGYLKVRMADGQVDNLVLRDEDFEGHDWAVIREI